MKYISLDLETTGLDRQIHQILQISVIVDDLENASIDAKDLPHFTCYVKHNEIVGSVFALNMNSWILGKILSPKQGDYPIYELHEATQELNKFLDIHFPNGRIPVAGKNVASFDIPFLPKEVTKRFSHRSIDPSVLYLLHSDKTPPDLKTCLLRAGIVKEVSHDAREDAMDVINVLRKGLNGFNMR